jgi:hypothetical protein
LVPLTTAGSRKHHVRTQEAQPRTLSARPPLDGGKRRARNDSTSISEGVPRFFRKNVDVSRHAAEALARAPECSRSSMSRRPSRRGIALPHDLPQTLEFSLLRALDDPFDRMIVAAARAMRRPLVTADPRLADSGLVDVIWD